MTAEGKKLALIIARHVIQSKTTVEEKARVKKAVHEALQHRVKRAVAEKREVMTKNELNQYLTFRETVLDVAKLAGASLAKNVAPDAYRAVSATIKTYRKKKNVKAKVPSLKRKVTKPKLKPVDNTAPVRVHRKQFAAALKVAGGNLTKTTLS